MKLKLNIPRNQSGFAHVLIIALLIVIGLSIFGTKQIINSSAASRDPGKITRSQSKIFREATRQYFKDGESFKKAKCMPEQVRISYYYGNRLPDGHSGKGAYAYTTLWGAFKKVPRKFLPDLVKIPSKDYCRIHWNVDASRKISKSMQCIAFMHEYGHLLGREHENNTTSVMNNNYSYDNITYRQAHYRFNTWHDNVSAKSLCADWVFQKRRT